MQRALRLCVSGLFAGILLVYVLYFGAVVVFSVRVETIALFQAASGVVMSAAAGAATPRVSTAGSWFAQTLAACAAMTSQMLRVRSTTAAKPTPANVA